MNDEKYATNGKRSAHPHHTIEFYGDRGEKQSHSFHHGLTKRELLAALAMQALCHPPEDSAPFEKWDMEQIAHHAVRAADALLKELAK